MAAIKNAKTFYNTEIPSNWEVYRLEKICSHFKSGFGITSEQIFESGEYPVYGGNGLRGYTNSFTHNGEYLLIGRQGALCGNIQRVSNKVYISEHAIAVQPNNENDIDFLAYKLEHKNLNRHSESSAQPGLSVEKLIRLKIELPSLPEQKAIAQVLSKADAAIHTIEKLIAQKELRKKWLMQQLLSEKRIVKNEKWCKSGVRKVKLGDIASIKKGKPITEKEIHEGYYPIIAGGKTSPYSHNQFTDENVITISASGAYAGYVAFHPQKIWASDCSVVDELKGKSVIGYLYYQLIFHQEKIYKLQTGGAQPHVFPKDIFHFPLFIVHSIEEQTAIAQVLQAADKEISLLKAKAEKLREQKKGLMQVLLTGKVRLKINNT